MSSTKQINQYPAAISIDGSADQLLIDPGGTGTYNKINRNTLLGITSTPIGASDSQTLQNKTLDNTNSITVKDGSLTVQNTADTTKRAVFSASGITTGTTRTLTLPNRSDTLVTLAGSETLTNKTITSPVITGGTIDNSAITVDSISGHTSATQVTVGGVLMNNGTIGTSGAVVAASILAGAVQPQALTSGTGTSWAMSTWTPTLGGMSKGNGTVTASYIQVGKLVFCRFLFTLGTTSTVTGDASITLPVTANSIYASASQHLGGSIVFQAGGGTYYGVVQIASTTQAFFEAQLASGTYVTIQNLGAAIPNTWASTNWMAGEFWFEAA